MSLEQIPQVSRTAEGLDGVAWNVLGQVYIPKEITEQRFTWYAVFPEETFVPPHTHTEQDEFLMPLDGVIDIVLGTPLPRIAATSVAMMLRALEQLATGAAPMAAAHFPQPIELYTPENL